jgi:hypothetical protein
MTNIKCVKSFSSYEGLGIYSIIMICMTEGEKINYLKVLSNEN